MQLRMLLGRMRPLNLMGFIITAIGTFAAFVATILQNTAAGAVADAGLFLHRLGMLTMLIGVGLLFVALLQRRTLDVVALRMTESDGRLWISPMIKENCLIIPNARNIVEVLQSVSRVHRMKVFAILAPNTEWSEEALQSLLQFPYLKVLDLQNSKIEEEALDHLADLPELRLLAAYKAISPERLKSLTAMIPEVVLRSDEVKLGFTDSDVVQPILVQPHPPSTSSFPVT